MQNPKETKNKERKKRTGVRVTKERFLKAIAGSCGNRNQIAVRMQIARASVNTYLNRSDWKDVRAVYDQECEHVGDIAETTIIELMKQRKDLGVAARTARWFLERKFVDRGYKPKKNISHECSKDNCLSQDKLIDLEKLPLELKRQLLQAIEEIECSEETQKPA